MLKDAILITGAGQRIGLYLAQQFLAQGDYPVVFTYRTPRPAVEALIEQGALGIQADFTLEGGLDRFLMQLHEQVASLRAVIHNASLWIGETENEAVDTLALEQMLAVHVTAPYRISRACHPLLLASNDANRDIIALSDCKVRGGHRDYVAYLSSKAGLESLMQSFAKSFAPAVKVNTIAPGLVMFNEGDSEAYRKQRLAESAIPVAPGEDVIWQAVQFLMNSPNSSGSTIELGQLKSEG